MENTRIKSEGVTKMQAKNTVEVCPLCDSKVDKGYVASKFIAWSDKKISEESFSPMIMEGAFVAFGSEAIVGRNCIICRHPIRNVEAFRCRKCNLIIFRCGEAK
jgi:hypothetical protein